MKLFIRRAVVKWLIKPVNHNKLIHKYLYLFIYLLIKYVFILQERLRVNIAVPVHRPNKLLYPHLRFSPQVPFGF